MKFAIITHSKHKICNGNLWAYEPYVREMDLWLNNVSETQVVAPLTNEEKTSIEKKYLKDDIVLKEIPQINFLSIKNSLISILQMPIICIKIFKAMLWADHIHLRCPGNIGLLGAIIQIVFPFKPKTVKYAGNWDPYSKQPLSYRIQKWIVSNTFLTKKCKVLVYGQWKNQSKNVIPFFTASYTKKEIEEISEKNLNDKIRFIYVGAFTKSKQPLLAVKVVEELAKEGYNVELSMYGNGAEFESIESYINTNNSNQFIKLYGNQPKEIIKEAYQKAHFLVFISRSEGWPKVVAEAMFWGCLPIASKVSCIPYMLNFGERGSLVDDKEDIIFEVKEYLNNQKLYHKKAKEGIKWSQVYTLDKFKKEISKLV